MQFGILVDNEGYFIAALRWADNETAPEFNKPQAGEKVVRPEDKKHLLRSAAAIAVKDSIARWDFKAETWTYPTERYWLVDSKGNVKGGRTYFPERPPEIKTPGDEIVTTPPPAKIGSRGRPIWNPTAGEWQWPRRVVIVNPNGEVVNAALEHRREDLPNIDVPPGWERFDEDQPGGIPTRPDGVVIGRGDKRNAQGDFERPQPPIVP